LLAYGLYRQFFPNLDPFGGSRLRANSVADILGNTLTQYWNSQDIGSADYDALVADEFIATDRINAVTGRNFTSWPEFFGPHTANGDYFTTVQRLNLSSELFDLESLGGFVPFGYDIEASNSSAPYKPIDILILTDGICASACSLFVEFMHGSNVSSVVIGGRPTIGPMQSTTSRGARAFSVESLDGNINITTIINSTTSGLVPNRTDTGMYINYLGVNLRDQIQRGSDIPLQFTYLAADCRIFWTFDTVNNYTALWEYAANALWTTPDLCVKDSRGQTTKSNDTAQTTSIAAVTHISQASASSTSGHKNPAIQTIIGVIPDPIQDSLSAKSQRATKLPAIGAKCQLNSKGNTIGKACLAGSVCKKVSFCDGDNVSHGTVCVPSCDPTLRASLQCSGGVTICSRDASQSDQASGLKKASGFCDPKPVRGSSCASPPSPPGENSPVNIQAEDIDKRAFKI
jgi:hypothetical protein